MNIPEEHYDKFEKFISLPENSIKKIVSILDGLDKTLTPHQLVDELYESLSSENLDKSTLFDIIHIFINLSNAKSSANLSTKAFLDELERVLLSTKIEEFKPTEKIMNQFDSMLVRVESILKPQVLDSATENQRSFLDVRIFQDLRTTYDSNESILGSAVIHRMKVVFRENGNLKELFLSLDLDDLQKINIEVEKAIKAESLLKKSFPNAKIIDL
jgi:hypothetical protein